MYFFLLIRQFFFFSLDINLKYHNKKFNCLEIISVLRVLFNIRSHRESCPAS